VLFLLRKTLGSFVLKLSLPSAKHLANLREAFGQVSVLLIVQGFDFPGELQQQFDEVHFGNTFIQKQPLFFGMRVARKKGIFNGFKE
jgi:hypothetical protein